MNTDDIKIASSQEKVSQTIEGLLALNGRIPAHTDTEITDVTEKQLESGDYEGKKIRGEEEDITEFQLDDDGREDPIEAVQQVQIEEAGSSDGGHRPREFGNDERIRGHKKKDIPNIWLEVYNKEDERKNKPIDKKLD